MMMSNTDHKFIHLLQINPCQNLDPLQGSNNKMMEDKDVKVENFEPGSTNLSKLIEDSSSTYIDTNVVKYKWTIKNFNMLSPNVKRIISPTFPLKSNDDTCTWHIQLFPNGQDDAHGEYVSIFLGAVDFFDNIYLLVSATIRIDDYEKTYTKKLTREVPSWGFSKFIKRNDLTNYVQDDTLTISCEITILQDIVHTNFTETSTIAVPSSSFTMDFNDLRTKNKYCDISFSVRGKEFPAHKIIVAARSPVLAKIVDEPTFVQTIRHIEIRDTDPDAFQEMLNYIYTDTAKISEDNVSNLLCVASKYQIERLQVMCEKFIAEKLTVKNAIDCLLLSDSHNAKRLKSSVIEFINQHIEDLNDTPEFKTMISTHSHLVTDMFTDLMKSRSLSVSEHEEEAELHRGKYSAEYTLTE